MRDRVASAEGALIRSVEVLAEPPGSLAGGPLQDRLDQAHAKAVAQARDRVAQCLSIPLGDNPDGFAHGMVANFDGAATWYDTLRATLDRAQAGASDDAANQINQTTAVLAAGGDVRSLRAAITPHELFDRLDDGWMLVAERPVVADRGLRQLIDDLAMAYGAAQPRLFYGVRSALGPPPVVSEHPRLLIQLLGVRAVLVMGGEHPPQQQAQMQPGFAAFVPAGYTAAHLPLDNDTVHLEIALTQLASPTNEGDLADGGGARRANDAMRAVIRADDDYEATRRSLRGASDQSWAERLFAPGGVHVVTAPAATSDSDELAAVVGGHQLRLTHEGTEVLVGLASGEYLTAESLAARCALSPHDVDEAMATLRQAGLLAPAPVAVGLRANERLTQVASAVLEDPSLIEAVVAQVDPDRWRPSNDGEVFHGVGVDVDVQPLHIDEPNAPVGQLREIAATLNARFFKADVVGPDPEDPMCLVRVRSSASQAVGDNYDPPASSDALGSDLLTHSTRKITWAFALTEANGGWVHLPAGSDAPNPQPGTLAAWVSSRPWQLTPCTQGERILVMGRLHGPAFL